MPSGEVIFSVLPACALNVCPVLNVGELTLTIFNGVISSVPYPKLNIAPLLTSNEELVPKYKS